MIRLLLSVDRCHAQIPVRMVDTICNEEGRYLLHEQIFDYVYERVRDWMSI